IRDLYVTGVQTCALPIFSDPEVIDSISFGEHAFGFRQQLDRVDHFRIADIFAPSATALDGSDGVVSVRGIPDRERARDRGWFLRSEERRVGKERMARGWV